MTWRQQRAEARALVHETMQVSCYLLSALPYDSNSGGPLAISARIHNKETKLGDQAGTSLNSAERYEAIPKAVFWRQDVIDAAWTLVRGNIISVGDGEAYHIDVVHPHDTETISVDIARLDADDSTGLPYPTV